MLSHSDALQSAQGSLDAVGSHRHVRCILQWPCPVVLLTKVWLCVSWVMEHNHRLLITVQIANWTMLQSGKGALLGIRAFHDWQHVQLKLSMLCDFGRLAQSATCHQLCLDHIGSS
ncbi:TPA: hypothetical protein ACH3X2_001454 [Trebouxia sp. C0005]